MKRAEAVETFHRASLALSALSIKILGELDTIKSPSARVRLLHSLARAEHALIAVHDTIIL